MTMIDDITQGVQRRGAVDTIRQGIEEAPALGKGLLLTFFLALVGATGRVAVPVVMQQSIDKGFVGGVVRLDLIVQLCIGAAVVVVVAAFSQRTAVHRLGHQPSEGFMAYASGCLNTSTD